MGLAKLAQGGHVIPPAETHTWERMSEDLKDPKWPWLRCKVCGLTGHSMDLTHGLNPPRCPASAEERKSYRWSPPS